MSQALAIYAAWLPYMRACIVGAPRIDLSGDPAGVVTEKEAMYAVQRLGNGRVKPQGAGHDPSRARR